MYFTRHRVGTLLLAALMTVPFATAGAVITARAAGAAITKYTDPTISRPADITVGPDGALWFINSQTDSIGRITTSGTVTNYTGPGIANALTITAGPDGALWFTSSDFANSNYSIGRITTTGAVTNYTDLTLAYPQGIVAGADGALWFTNAAGGSIGRITTGGTVTSYPDSSIVLPYGIAVGSDGALWFTNAGSNSIGRITMTGTITNYSDPSILFPWGITAGSDGALWFTNSYSATSSYSIGRITTAGTITNYADPSMNASIRIVAGPDGALWSAYPGDDSIGRITTAGTVTNYAATGMAGPQGIVSGPDGALWFTNFNDNSIGRITTDAPTVSSSPAIGGATRRSGSGSVAFAAPADNGESRIIRYTAMCSSSDGGATGSNAGTASPIVVSHLTNGHRYTCVVTATNAVGTSGPSAASNAFVPAAVPEAPRLVSAVQWGSGAANLRWTEPSSGGSPITGYVVMPFLGSVPQPARAFKSIKTTAIITRLRNGKAYRFEIAAQNALGLGAWSRPTTALTAGAPGQPAKVKALKIRSGSLKVTFAAPSSNGAKITSYNATCKSSDQGIAKTKTGKVSPIAITGLTRGKKYTCTVKATNSRGTGPASGASKAVTA